MRGQSQESGDKVRFGVFEADLRTGELRKHGIRIRLQGQPFKILAALLERPGELVTRDELQKRIWGAQTIGDFDHSLGTAIKKLRDALGDSAETPRYVETLAKRGFRFILPVETIEPQVVGRVLAPAVELPELRPSQPVPEPVGPAPVQNRRNLRIVLAGLIGTPVVAFLLWSWFAPQSPPILRFTKITSSDRIFPGQISLERFPGLGTDGVRIYFPEVENGRIVLAYTSLTGGETHIF
jgi:DNA-binding winged helix-turn-helix (wHTH) protein